MKFKLTIISITVFLLLGKAFSQLNLQEENDEYLYWQPGVKIDFEDYKAEHTDLVDKMATMSNLSTFSSINIHSILDIPKDSSKSGLLEKVYFAPVMCKRQSSIIYKDPISVKFDMLLLNLAELSARMARKQLDSLSSVHKGKYGILLKYYFHFKVEMNERMLNNQSKLFSDIVFNQRPGAFERWERYVSALLKKTEKWATKPEDCQRFLTGKPIIENYIKSPRIYSTDEDKERDKKIQEARGTTP